METVNAKRCYAAESQALSDANLPPKLPEIWDAGAIMTPTDFDLSPPSPDMDLLKSRSNFSTCLSKARDYASLLEYQFVVYLLQGFFVLVQSESLFNKA